MARVNEYQLPLTEDEHRAIALQARGMTRDVAAREMGVALGTYVSMLRRVYAKTKTPGAAAAVAVLMARGDLRADHIFPTTGDHKWGGPASDLVFVRIHTELDAGKLPGLGDAYQALMRKGL